MEKMKKGQKVAFIVLVVLMVSIVLNAIIIGLAGEKLIHLNGVQNQVAEEQTHIQVVDVTFTDGTMVLSINEKCGCGQTTVFDNTSDTAAKARGIISAIKCDEAFFIEENGENINITREDLLKRVDEYSFKS